ETAKVMNVTESGYISLPLINQIKASGLTEAQLELAIKQAYADKHIVDEAQVSVVTVTGRARTFTVYGAVPRAGQYAIPESKFRLMDAITSAGDLTSQTGIEYIYIMRQKDQDVTEIPGETPLPPQTMPTTQPGDILAPRSMSPIVSDVVMLQTQDP